MSAAFALWSVLVEPGKKTHITAEADIRISNAALDAELKDQSSRSSIKFTYEKAVGPGDDPEKRPPISSVLCSLTPGKVGVGILSDHVRILRAPRSNTHRWMSSSMKMRT